MDKIENIARLRGLCVRYELSGSEILGEYTDEQLAELYNGIGPDWFPSKLRDAIDNLCSSLQPMALIHDVRWCRSDGTRRSFYGTNEELRENGYAIAENLYKWWDIRRYWLKHQAKVFGDLCDSFGWGAYKVAYERYVNKEVF